MYTVQKLRVLWKCIQVQWSYNCYRRSQSGQSFSTNATKLLIPPPSELPLDKKAPWINIPPQHLLLTGPRWWTTPFTLMWSSNWPPRRTTLCGVVLTCWDNCLVWGRGWGGRVWMRDQVRGMWLKRESILGRWTVSFTLKGLVNIQATNCL